ncbi:hypothetical protein ACWKW1_25445 [Brevibacillus parabrevis]
MDEFLYLTALVVGSGVAYYIYRYQKEANESEKISLDWLLVVKKFGYCIL